MQIQHSQCHNSDGNLSPFTRTENKYYKKIRKITIFPLLGIVISPAFQKSIVTGTQAACTYMSGQVMPFQNVSVEVTLQGERQKSTIN